MGLRGRASSCDRQCTRRLGIALLMASRSAAAGAWQGGQPTPTAGTTPRPGSRARGALADGGRHRHGAVASNLCTPSASPTHTDEPPAANQSPVTTTNRGARLKTPTAAATTTPTPSGAGTPHTTTTPGGPTGTPPCGSTATRTASWARPPPHPRPEGRRGRRRRLHRHTRLHVDPGGPTETTTPTPTNAVKHDGDIDSRLADCAGDCRLDVNTNSDWRLAARRPRSCAWAALRTPRPRSHPRHSLQQGPSAHPPRHRRPAAPTQPPTAVLELPSTPTPTQSRRHADRDSYAGRPLGHPDGGLNGDTDSHRGRGHPHRDIDAGRPDRDADGGCSTATPTPTEPARHADLNIAWAVQKITAIPHERAARRPTGTLTPGGPTETATPTNAAEKN